MANHRWPYPANGAWMDKIPARLSRIQILTIFPMMGEIFVLLCWLNYKQIWVAVKQANAFPVIYSAYSFLIVSRFTCCVRNFVLSLI